MPADRAAARQAICHLPADLLASRLVTSQSKGHTWRLRLTADGQPRLRGMPQTAAVVDSMLAGLSQQQRERARQTSLPALRSLEHRPTLGTQSPNLNATRQPNLRTDGTPERFSPMCG
jgi:hypothetical protein